MSQLNHRNLLKCTALASAVLFAAAGNAALVDHYELEGNGNDSAGANANGTVGTNVTFGAGPVGQAATFPSAGGTDNRIEVAQADAFDPSTGDFSIAFWIKASDQDAFEGVIDALAGGNNEGYQIFVLDDADDKKIRIRLDGSSSAGVNFDSGFSTSSTEFQHVAITVDRTANLTYYLNGVAQTSESTAGVTGGLTPSQDLWIGSANSLGLNGSLDDVRFYNSVLSAGDIAALVPEPGSLALLGLGGLCVLHRRRF